MTDQLQTDHTLVFGDDGSSGADLAWLWINSHHWKGWRLEIVTAVPPQGHAVAGDSTGAFEWEPPSPRSAFAEADIDRVVNLRFDGDPRVALLRPADLLVVGRRGPGLVKALHLGSTVEWLMTRPPAPMVIARHGRRTGAITVCHDGSRHAAAAIETICALPWTDEVSVTVVTVDDGRVDAEAAVDDAMLRLAAAGISAQPKILTGEPTLELLRHLETCSSDLVALGTQGLTGIRRARVGSTAGVLAHATDKSVLLVCDRSDERTDDEARAPS
jgi:nucleotide-binding universal stress UspA family protein